MQKNSSITYVLYYTEGCHLCDIAQALIEQTAINYQHIDICENESLAERYGMSIPVFVQGKRELFWPFDAEQLQEFLGD
ncbi:glutaredoxin family protein [Shewanella polaris]|uniref:Glutaredoxin family protein n=1 Tax=Shewanella polaris TaxID=2588449 RepID=A0A4Y5YDA7_9GAMM|nr:glutaredoxin family protein [Shewanella polaris]QDE30664.1 glutaredoxin family protein [Shewanella polaris]